jgi:aminopeptidase N
MPRHLIAALLLLASATPAAAQRLSGEVEPSRYELWFAPDFATDTFQGRTTIAVTLAAPTTAITLHAAELTFEAVTLESGGRVQTATIDLDPDAELATFRVPDALPAGEATVHAVYTGVLNDRLRGFYRSEANGREYAVTQLQATDARRAFPSFDEPDYKATFAVSLMVDDGDTAISNGALLSDTPGPEPGKHTLVFEETLRMSPYLVAMFVGDFVCAEGGVGDTPIRVCSTPDKLALTGFALEAAEQQLAWFNDYFGIRYPFAKVDVIAIPDFAAGAMENTGAISFREQFLLIDPDTASLGLRKAVAGILAHEIAHMWTGDLVTMRWWDDIWLNEGFATWLEKKPLADWRPDWDVQLDEARDTQGAVSIDALQATRPVRVAANTPEEINEVFDGIAYEKAAAVLRMVEAWVGPERFRDAVRAYVRRYAFDTATAEDLWTELARVTGAPVDDVLRTYIDQPGVPVLGVATSCVAGDTVVRLTQQRFTGAPGAIAGPETWAVPVCVAGAGGAPVCEVMQGPTHEMTVPGCGAPPFVNAGASGYYLTEYAPGAVGALAARAAALSPVERIALLGDEWWMLQAGRHDAPARGPPT